MKRLFLVLDLLAISTGASGCKGVTAHAYTRLPKATARSFRDDHRHWVELKIEGPPERIPWQIEFEAGIPQGLEVHPDATGTRFLWIASEERIKFFGNNGYRLKIKNSTQAYDLLITLRPDYSVVLEFLMRGLGR